MSEILADVRAFIPNAAGIRPDDDLPMLGKWAPAPVFWLSPASDAASEYRGSGSVGAASVPVSELADFMQSVVNPLQNLSDFRLRIGLHVPLDTPVGEGLVGRTRRSLWPIVKHRLGNLPVASFEQRVQAVLGPVEDVRAAASHMQLVLSAVMYLSQVVLVNTPEGGYTASVSVAATQPESLDLLTSAAVTAFRDHSDQPLQPLPPPVRMVRAYGPLRGDCKLMFGVDDLERDKAKQR